MFVVGVLCEMTDAEEELIAEGMNFLHSRAAVHTCKLELLFRFETVLEHAKMHLEVICFIMFTVLCVEMINPHGHSVNFVI